MKSYLTSTIISMAIFVSVMNFTSCKVLQQNESKDITSSSNKTLIIFLNCSILYDSINQEYKINLIDKTIAEGKIKKTMVNPETYDQGDFKYCLLDKNNQLISCTFIQNPLNKEIEYVDEQGFMRKKSIRLDSTPFSLRIQLTTDSRYISFKRDNKQLLLVDLNIK